MRVQYNIAICSFCEELTMADGAVTPVGALLLSEYSRENVHHRMALALLINEEDALKLTRNKLNQFMLSSLDELIANQFNHILKLDRDINLEKLAIKVHDMLRNSIYISDLSDVREAEFDGDKSEIAHKLFSILEQEFTDKILNPSNDKREPSKHVKNKKVKPNIHEQFSNHQWHLGERPFSGQFQALS